MSNWYVELRLYKSQKNPKWGLRSYYIKRLFKTLAEMKSCNSINKMHKFTGRGFYLYYDNKLIIICSNKKILYIKMNLYENITDINKELESLLISSAPDKYKRDIQFYLNK
jgi:predicted RNA-binding protein YlxR (DUF448 family)